MSSKVEPAIWSRDTGQRISWYDSCQLNIVCMSNIKDIYPRLHDLVLAGWQPCCATSFVVVVVVVRRRRRRWAHAPVIHAASHFDHKKRVKWVPICMHTCGSFFYNYGAPLGRAPLLSSSTTLGARGFFYVFTKWPAPRWIDCSFGRALYRYLLYSGQNIAPIKVPFSRAFLTVIHWVWHVIAWRTNNTRFEHVSTGLGNFARFGH